MENFICNNPIILQHTTKFGLEVWVVPLLVLGLGLIIGPPIQKAVGQNSKYSKRTIDESRPRGPALLCILIFIGLCVMIMQDRAVKINGLKAGNYSVYSGQITKIERGFSSSKQRMVGAHSHIDFYIKGHAISSKGRSYPLTGHNRVRTKSGLFGYWGKSCFGRTCRLNVGDKVQIKGFNYPEDTLSIKKCEM